MNIRAHIASLSSCNYLFEYKNARAGLQNYMKFLLPFHSFLCRWQVKPLLLTIHFSLRFWMGGKKKLGEQKGEAWLGRLLKVLEAFLTMKVLNLNFKSFAENLKIFAECFQNNFYIKALKFSVKKLQSIPQKGWKCSHGFGSVFDYESFKLELKKLFWKLEKLRWKF